MRKKASGFSLQAESEQAPEGGSASMQPEACSPPAYKRSPALKHDETNRRPARPSGPVRVCQCCYRKCHDIFDHVCKRCLKDRHELATLEQEIAAVYPATARLTSAQIFRKVWEKNVMMGKVIRDLRSIIQEKKRP